MKPGLAISTALVVVGLLCGAVDSLADVHPNAAGGVDIDQAFHAGDVDNINLFNGALTVTIPIGISYPVSSHFSYHLSLIGNSNPWLYSTALDSNLEYAAPSPCSNAGLGWRVSLGTLGLFDMASPPTCVATDAVSGNAFATYEAPDGSQHLFYPTLHPGEQDDQWNGTQDNVGTSTENVTYTRDGSYLRLKRYVGYSEIEFPDGMVHRFDASGHIIQMRDSFSDGVSTNLVNISYPPLAQCSGALSGESSCWKIADSQGRTQWIYFVKTYSPYLGAAGYGSTISRIVLSAFNASQATYLFKYQETTVRRGCPNIDQAFGPVAVPLLTSVVLPDGGVYAPGSGYLQIAGSGCELGSASLTALTLPTMGTILWSYQTYAYPTGSSTRPRFQSNQGVATRSTYDANGSPIGTWRYSTQLTSPASAVELINTVTDPLGNQDVRYFSVATNSVYGPGANQFDYGRQYSPARPFGNGLFLAEQVIDAGGQVQRSDYVRLERDLVDLSVSRVDSLNDNARIAERTAVYADGAQAHYVDQFFDGVGKYRLRTTGGTFAGNNVQFDLQQWNSGRATYTVDQASNTQSGGYIPVPPTAPWIFTTKPYSYVEENGVADFRSFCYDLSTGFLLRSRTYSQNTTSSVAMSANDVIEVYVPQNGDTIAEKYYGGDIAQVTPTNSDLCQQALPSAPEYQINNTYTYGVLASSRYAGASYYSMRHDIDQSTGLTHFSYDSAGIPTGYQYGGIGRLVYVKPRDGAWIAYQYHNATGAPSPSAATLTVDYEQNGTASTSLAQVKYTYDAFGRKIESATRMPNGTTSSQTTSYNALGWKTAVSAPGSSNVNTTQYLNYDPFGRPGLIRPPDSLAANGHIHDIAYTYGGIQAVTRKVGVGGSWTGSNVVESLASTTQTFDRFGRLASVCEASGLGSDASSCGQADHAGPFVTTRYQYDPGGRMVSATTISAGTTQARSWGYDGRGYLNWEVHPETMPDILAIGHHKDYLSYDSRGHFHRAVDGVNDLSYTYDSSERPLLIFNTANGPNCSPNPITTPTCVKQFTYDDVASGGLGRLFSASRFNHILMGTTPFTDEWTYTYTYNGLDGRVSQRSLQHAWNGSTTTGQESFAQAWAYTQLGKFDSETYPDCASTFAACTGTTGRVVQNLYTNGFLTGVNGYTSGSGISYAVNGTVSAVTHANGVTASYGLDPHNLARPASISASGPTGVLWSSGGFSFDGSGSVTQIGQSYFTYDGVSRLTNARVETSMIDNANPALDTFSSQSMTYDAFGNLTGMVPGNMTPTDPATNHLAGGTYDASGNLRTWNGGPSYDFDEFNNLKHYKNGAQEWFYMYDSDDERVWSYQTPVNGNPRFDRWTLRGLDGKLRRTFELYGYNWTNAWGGSNVWEDFIYRDGTVLAGYVNTGERRHMDTDHLGTPRLITNLSGAFRSYHVYLPYGSEVATPGQDSERLKFAGQERDLADPASSADDLDYLHARHFNSLTGRFLSLDLGHGEADKPQSWNRYSYAMDNPETFVDPSGRTAAAALALPAAAAEIAAVPPMIAGAAAAATLLGAAYVTHLVAEQPTPGGGESIDARITDLFVLVLFGKEKGRGRETQWENLTTDQVGKLLEEAKRAGDTALVKKLIKELKWRNFRNPNKARGGKREPKKPPQGQDDGGDKLDELPFGGGDISDFIADKLNAEQQFYEDLGDFISLIPNLDEERSYICGVGVASCPF